MYNKINELRSDSQNAKAYFMNMLAYTLGPMELKKMAEKNEVMIVDVRLKADYDISHIPSAISIPKEVLADNLTELSKDKVTVIYCYNQQCHLGASACLIMAEYGYPVMLLEGGFKTWSKDFEFEVTGVGD